MQLQSYDNHVPLHQESFFPDDNSDDFEVVHLNNQAGGLRVAKSNVLVEAHYDLSPLENKLMLLAMSNVRKNQETLTQQVFRIPDLCRHLGIKESNASRDLKRLSKSLMQKQLEIRRPKSDDWIMHQWVSRTWVRNGDFGIKFDDDLKPYLLGLVSRFTMFQLERILKMTSSYAIRLYELLVQYAKIGSRTFVLDPAMCPGESWPDFSKVMAYNPQTYSRFSNISQRIIKPAIEQIEQLTEIKNIRVSTKKHQRKTIAITFEFDCQPILEELKATPVYRNLQFLGVKDSTIKDLVSEFDSGRVERNARYVKEAMQSQKVSNPAGLLISAISNDYAAGVRSGHEPSTSVEQQEATADPKIDHPLYEKCATLQEFKILVAAEKEKGVSFSSYNDFHKFQLEKRFRRT